MLDTRRQIQDTRYKMSDVRYKTDTALAPRQPPSLRAWPAIPSV